MQDQNSFPQEPSDQTEQQHVPVSKDGVELVGKTAQDRQPDAKSNSSFLKRYFDTGLKKQKTDKETKPKPNVPEQFLLSWQAPEFVQTHKPFGWYAGFILFFL